MATFFISDTHLGHGNILKYCGRPFLDENERQLLAAGQDFRVSAESIQRMDETILATINAVVGPDDVLWHLGDFCFGDFEAARRYRESILCRTVHLIWGNHDRHFLRALFTSYHEQHCITAEGQDIVLNHYPMLSWERSHRGSWHLFGHVHGRATLNPLWKAVYDHQLMLDVGVDGWRPGAEHIFRPWSLAEVRGYMEAKRPGWEASRGW